MADIEEPPVLSFKERIAKFNQAKDLAPSPSQPVAASKPRPPRPQPARPAPVPSKTVNNPPSNGHGSVFDRSGIGNEPAPVQEEQRVSTTVPGVPGVPPGGGQNGAKPPPPALPSRKTPPALPQRQSADPALRRGSLESTASDGTSLSTKTMPPPLPSRPQSRPPSRPPSQASRNESVRPRLPSRQASNTSLSTTASNSGSAPVPPPRLPPRTPPRTPVLNGDAQPAPPKVPDPRQFGFASKGIPVQNGDSQPAPPKVSSDPRQFGFGSKGIPAQKSDSQPAPPKRDPRQLGFGSKDGGEAPVPSQSPVQNGDTRPALPKREPTQSVPPQPPPVPMASRPDLSKLQATKPRMHAPQAAAASCLKCRDFSHPDTHAAQYPRQSLPSQNIPWLANELTAPFPSQTDKARAIFTWLHHNIEYDVYSFFNNCVKPSTPDNTLATGLAVCSGYASLFTALATHAGLESMVISGHGKGIGYADPAPGSALPPFDGNHAWNVVRIDNGEWKLIDSCWGAGNVQGHGQPYEKNFKPENFTESNDEFGLRHYPSNRDQFFRDDGRPFITWEEYLLGIPNSPECVEQPFLFVDAHKYNLGARSFHPATRRIATQSQGPMRFQFSLICEHWTLEHHSKTLAPVFLLLVHGDGKKEYLPFEHIRGGSGGGDTWVLDVPDARMLGTPGETLPLAVLTKFGDKDDARGVTVEEYKAKKGRVAMSFGFVAQWDLA